MYYRGLALRILYAYCSLIFTVDATLPSVDAPGQAGQMTAALSVVRDQES